MISDQFDLQVQEYKESLKKKAEERVLKGFPETIVELNELLEKPLFKDRNFIDVRQELNIPVPDPIVLNRYALVYSMFVVPSIGRYGKY